MTLTVDDGDGGIAIYESAIKIGSEVADTIPITNNDFLASDVSTLMILGLAGKTSSMHRQSAQNSQ